MDAGMGPYDMGRDRHLDVAPSPRAVAGPCGLRSMRERSARPARLNGSNKVTLLRDVRVTHGVNAFMKTMEATLPRPPNDTFLAQATRPKFVDVEHALELSREACDRQLAPSEA